MVKRSLRNVSMESSNAPSRADLKTNEKRYREQNKNVIALGIKRVSRYILYKLDKITYHILFDHHTEPVFKAFLL